MKLPFKLLLEFKDQVVLVLADYRSMDKNTLALDGTRIQIANRIVDNLVILASKRKQVRK